MGSSPLTRGKLVRIGGALWRVGLIPAHAGKTRRSSLASSRAAGSSPLTRGKRAQVLLEDASDRLIPAHAGKTLPDMRFYCADRSDLGNP